MIQFSRRKLSLDLRVRIIRLVQLIHLPPASLHVCQFPYICGYFLLFSVSITEEKQKTQQRKKQLYAFVQQKIVYLLQCFSGLSETIIKAQEVSRVLAVFKWVCLVPPVDGSLISFWTNLLNSSLRSPHQQYRLHRDQLSKRELKCWNISLNPRKKSWM